MAKLITTEWQEISRGSTTYADIVTYAKYSNQDKTTNKTTFQLRTIHYNPNYNVSYDWWRAGLYGEETGGDYDSFSRGQRTIFEFTKEIEHNEDGSSPTTNVLTWWVASFGGNVEVSEDIYFPNIQRYSIIQNATNFNDEGNPTITFTNARLYGLRAKLLVGNTEIYSEDLQGDETNYTYSLTTNQRNQLRTLCVGKTLEVTLQICSIEDDEIIYTSSTTATMSIVNAEPTFTYTMAETNQNVINVLGGSSASSIIKNASVVDITFTPTAYKSATISAVNVVYNGLTYTATTSPYTVSIPIVNSNTFTLSVIDSRGYVTSQVDSVRTLIDYEAVKTNQFSFKREAPTSSNIIFNGEFTYYSSFGDISNIPVVKWKLDDGSYNTIPSSSYSIDTTNHKLTITNYTLSNALVYTSVGQFTIYIEDKLTSDFVTSDSGKVNRGIPTFEAGEHDLQVNGDLYVADTDRNNKVNVLTAIASATSIEESGNGYIKFKDGTMICWGSKEGSVGVTTRWDAFYYSDNIDFSNFAKSFIATPKVSISASSVSAGYLYLVATSPSTNKQPSTTSAGGFCIIRPSSSGSVGYSVSYIAIGRWKN